MGTPQYMAPEQILGLEVDARSDQFSYCLVLFEALWGARPFTGRSLREMLERITQGQIERPAGASVPGWLDRIAMRGLKADPDERYPTMAELLADLENDPAIARARVRARRLRWGMGLMSLAFAGLAGWGVWYGTTRGARLCASGGDASRLAGVWDEPTRTKVRTAFQKVERPNAQDTFERVARTLDGYAGDWVAARVEACEATHVRGEQSDRLLDLRMQCLDRRLGELRALTEMFATRTDPEVLDKAVQAAMGLIPLAQCADAKALTAAVPPPEDPEVRRRVEGVRKRLDEVDALEKIGKYQEARKQAEGILGSTTAVGYEPVEAEAMLRVGSALEKIGQYQEAEQQLRRTAMAADACGHTEIRARALNRLIYVVGSRLARFSEGEGYAEWAAAVIEYARDKGAILAEWNRNLGSVLYDEGQYDRALLHHEKARTIWEETFGPEHPFVATSHNNIGTVLYSKGEYDRSLEHYTRALEIREKALGLEHPDVGTSLNNIGLVLEAQGDYDGALAYLERGLRLREQALGPDHYDVAASHNNIAIVMEQRGELDRALAHYKKAHAIWEKALGPRHPDVALARNNMAIIHYEMGDYRQAQAQHERALRDWENALGPDHPFLAWPLYGLGLLRLRANDPGAAVKLFERALAVCGADKCNGNEEGPLRQAQFGLARALWATGGDRRRARRLAGEALGFFKAQKSKNMQTISKEAEAWLARHE